METREKMEEELVRVEQRFCALQQKEAAMVAQAASLRSQLEEHQSHIAKDKMASTKTIATLASLDTHVAAQQVAVTERERALNAVIARTEAADAEYLRLLQTLGDERHQVLTKAMAFSLKELSPSKSIAQLDQETWEVEQELDRVHAGLSAAQERIAEAETVLREADALTAQVTGRDRDREG